MDSSPKRMVLPGTTNPPVLSGVEYKTVLRLGSYTGNDDAEQIFR